MRFMSMVKSSEDHRLGPPPQALMEAKDRLGQEMTKAGESCHEVSNKF